MSLSDALEVLEDLPFSSEDLEEPMYCSKCGEPTSRIYTCNACNMTYFCPSCFVDHLRCENSFPQMAKKNLAIVAALTCNVLPKQVRDQLHEAL
jgi:hypothetical protein